MTDNYALEPLTDRIFDELEPLMLDAFGHGGDRRYFDWKYRQNPAGHALGNIARTDAGEIAAFYGMIPEMYEFRGERRRIYQSCDTMTHSQHRRRGLFQRLAQATYDQALAADPGFFAYGFSGPTSTPGFLKMNWKIREELPFLFQPYPLTLLKWRRGKARIVESITADLIEMIARAQPKSGPGVCRDEGFVRWRLGNPLRRYEYLLADAAYVVFTRMEGFVFVMDFWEQDRRSGSPVVRALRAIASDSRMKGLLTWTSAQSEFAGRLRGHLFIRNRLGRGPASQTVPFISYGSDPFDASDRAWAVNALDHDSQ
jgi:hypothetical protein